MLIYVIRKFAEKKSILKNISHFFGDLMHQSKGLSVPNKLCTHEKRYFQAMLSVSDYTILVSTLSVISNHASQNNKKPIFK